jgi:phosphate transport system substrate-binding protein
MLRHLVAATLAAVLGCSTAFAAPLEIHGSTTVSSNLLMPKKAEIEKAAGIELQIVANGSGRGLADLAEGKTTLAMISAPMSEVVASLKAKGQAIDDSKMQAFPVGEARMAFAVHPSNPVHSLTDAQMVDILSGKITNWKEIGGADKPIVVIVESKGGGVRTFVEDFFLKGGDITANKREVPNATQIPQIVAQLDSALGIITKKVLGPSIAELKTSKDLAQPLILVTNGAPSADISRVIAAAKAAAGG